LNWEELNWKDLNWEELNWKELLIEDMVWREVFVEMKKMNFVDLMRELKRNLKSWI
jgi:hypothetical protein